jgi:hypothetical protein
VNFASDEPPGNSDHFPNFWNGDVRHSGSHLYLQTSLYSPEL